MRKYFSPVRQITREWKSTTDNGGNINCIIVGPPRKGKSYTMEGLSFMYNPEKYSISTTVWDIEPFVQRYNEASKSTCIKFDEAGVGVNSRDWFAKKSKQFVAIMQTMGFKNLLVMMTTPSFDYIDSQARKLFHWYIELLDRTDKYVVLKIRKIQFNPQTGKSYFKRPRVYNRKGMPYYLNVVKFYKPPQHIIEAYDKFSETWKEKLGQDIQKLIKEAYREEVDEEKAIEEVLANKEYFLKKWGKKMVLPVDKIESHFKIKYRPASRIRAGVLSKLDRETTRV